MLDNILHLNLLAFMKKDRLHNKASIIC